MPLWTIQCGYNTAHARTVVVEAAMIEQACENAITEADNGSDWRLTDHVGDTYVDAVREGRHDEAWTNGQSVPARFTEAGCYAPRFSRQERGILSDLVGRLETAEIASADELKLLHRALSWALEPSGASS